MLSVGTTHPLGIAGISFDQRIAQRLDIRLVTVIAGISAQHAGAVTHLAPVDDATIGAQFAALVRVPVGAIRIGALLGRAAVGAVARELDAWRVPVVCDPVIAASTGERLADDATVAALTSELFSRCTLVTPNLHEAERIVGQPVRDVAEMQAAAHAICARTGARACLVKGGHLAGDAVDVLADAAGTAVFEDARLPGTLRGTGDLLALATATAMAVGSPLRPAIEAARAFVRMAIAEAVPFAGASTLP